MGPRRILASVLVFLSLLSLIGCSGGSRGSYPGGRAVKVFGIVQDSNNQPLAGVLVSLVGKKDSESVTDENGTYSLTAEEVQPEEDITIEVTSELDDGTIVSSQLMTPPIPGEITSFELNMIRDENGEFHPAEINADTEESSENADPIQGAGQVLEDPSKSADKKKKKDSVAEESGGVVLGKEKPAAPKNDDSDDGNDDPGNPGTGGVSQEYGDVSQAPDMPFGDINSKLPGVGGDNDGPSGPGGGFGGGGNGGGIIVK